MSWYVLSDDGRESWKKWSNDVASSKSYILIVDEASLLIIIHKKYIFDINHQIQSLMKQLFRKNRRFRKRLTEAKKRIVEMIQLFNTATLQQMSKKKKKEEWENDKCRREVDGGCKDEENYKKNSRRRKKISI